MRLDPVSLSRPLPRDATQGAPRSLLLAPRVALAFALGGAFALACLLTACSGGSSAARRSQAPAGAALPGSSGPLAGTHWNPKLVRVGELLHDDGTRLWAVSLSGKKQLVWQHPRADVAEISAGPSGRELAFTVRAEPGPSQKQGVSMYLYLLGSDGRVRLIDEIKNFGEIDDPTFLRSPTQPGGPVLLYWARFFGGGFTVNRITGRPDSTLMVLKGGRVWKVELPLRYGEGIDTLAGFPGSPYFTVGLWRQENTPTRREILSSGNSYRKGPKTSFHFLPIYYPVAETDVPTGTGAWLTPRDFVVPVMQRAFPKLYSLKLFRAGCEYYGAHLVYQGTGIDLGESEAPWMILPEGNRHVLVLGAKPTLAFIAHKAKSVPWLSVDVRTGRITPTRARFDTRLGHGTWTFVQPPEHAPLDPNAGCTAYHWDTAP